MLDAVTTLKAEEVPVTSHPRAGKYQLSNNTGTTLILCVPNRKRRSEF